MNKRKVFKIYQFAPAVIVGPNQDTSISISTYTIFPDLFSNVSFRKTNYSAPRKKVADLGTLVVLCLILLCLFSYKSEGLVG